MTEKEPQLPPQPKLPARKQKKGDRDGKRKGEKEKDYPTFPYTDEDVEAWRRGELAGEDGPDSIVSH